jgi:hypothetical protein
MLTLLTISLMTSFSSSSARLIDSNDFLALAPMAAGQTAPDISSLNQRLIEIDTELDKTKVRWPTWAIVTTIVGGTGFAIFGLLAIALFDVGSYAALGGYLMLIVAAPFLVVGIIGLIGGIVGMGVAAGKVARLKEERLSVEGQLQQMTPSAPPPPAMVPPAVFRDLPVVPLTTVAQF